MEQEVKCGIDIGGTLVKIAYYSTSVDEDQSQLAIKYKGKIIQFQIFNNSNIQTLIDFLIQKDLVTSVLKVTGGGAFKFQSILEEKLNIKIQKVDEMLSLQQGLHCIQELSQPDAYTLNNFEKIPNTLVYPFLLVSIGSGVSILEIRGPQSYQRVGGTCVGGGTLLGLARYILNVQSYEELLKLSSEGDNAKVDLLTGDIYNNEDNIVAASMGKIAMGFGE